jgi:PAS domain S-box-containing protein
MENAHDAISVLTPDGVLLEVNHRLEEMVGRSREELLGHRFAEFLPAETAEIEHQRFRRLAADGATEMDNVGISLPDGRIIYADWRQQLVQLGDEQVVVAIGRDVTERNQAQREVQLLRKSAEEALRASEEQVRLLLDSTGEANLRHRR